MFSFEVLITHIIGSVLPSYVPTQAWQYAVRDSFVGLPYPHHAALREQTVLRRHPTGAGGVNFNLWRTQPLHAVEPRFTRVLHLVRCPGRHTASFTSHLLPSYEFVLQAMRRLRFAGLPASTARHLQRFGLALAMDEAEEAGWDGERSDDNLFSGCNYGDHRGMGTERFVARARPPRRGHRCWLYFSAAAWVFWNRLAGCHADGRYRVEDQLAALVADACSAVLGSGSEADARAARRLACGAEELGRLSLSAGQQGPEIANRTDECAGDDDSSALSGASRSLHRLFAASGLLSTPSAGPGTTLIRPSVHHRAHLRSGSSLPAVLRATDPALLAAVAELAAEYGYPHPDRGCGDND